MTQSLVASPEDVLNESLNALFRESGSPFDSEDARNRAAAFSSLARTFLAASPHCYRVDDIQTDHHALRLMLGRFQRDAFGVGRLWQALDTAVAKGELGRELADSMKDDVQGLGLRVNSDQPRKTRIAAVFSFWMMVFRPVSLCCPDPAKDAAAAYFCSKLNFWIARTYLSKFGEIKIGNQSTGPEILKRIEHDFTFRGINLSSLEVLYCSIFHARQAPAATPSLVS